jgi:hypothetical protein
LQGAADCALDPLRRLQQLVQPDAGVDAHGVEHMDQVLGADVAGGPRRKRAAAQAGDGAVEIGDAFGQRRQHVGKTAAAGVVEVAGDAVHGDGPLRRPQQRGDVSRVGHAGGIGEGHPFHAGFDGLVGEIDYANGIDVPLVGAAPGGAKRQANVHAVGLGALGQGLAVPHALLDRAVHVLVLEGLAGHHHQLHAVYFGC